MPTRKDTSSSAPDQGRRRWLQTSATTLGAVLLPLPSIELQRQRTPHHAEEQIGNSESKGNFFSARQYVLVEELTETILPTDSRSQGAKAARVVDYIVKIVGEGVENERKALWKEGLRLVDIMSEHAYGKRFVALNRDQRFDVLKILSDNEGMNELLEVRFFRDLKELTVRGYYTSKIGIHEELRYKGNKILIEYIGCDGPASG